MERVSGPAEFQAAVLDARGPVLALFYAAWCSFCQSYLPLFREADVEGAERVEVDISSEESPLWDDYRIQVVPTLILFAEGRILGRADGVLGRGLTEADLDGLVDIAMGRA